MKWNLEKKLSTALKLSDHLHQKIPPPPSLGNNLKPIYRFISQLSGKKLEEEKE